MIIKMQKKSIDFFGMEEIMLSNENKEANHGSDEENWHTVRPPMTEEILEYQGKYWTLSGKRLSYMRDKTKDNRFFILTLFAIAKVMERRGKYTSMEKIQLAVGLPPEHYGLLRDRFGEYFKNRGMVEFKYAGKPYRIFINRVMVFPQAYAAVIPQSSLIVKTVRVFVIDIGGYTTDVLLLRNGKPDLQFCRSLETGIITMNNEIVRKVGALHDMRIEEEHISAVLGGQEIVLPEDIKITIKEEAERHAKEILDQLRELQVDLRANPAIFIGGGSMLLKSYLQQSPLVIQADFIEDCHAIGYEMLAQSQMNRKTKQ